MQRLKGAWVVKSVKQTTLGCSLGHDIRILRRRPTSGSVISRESAWDCLSLSLCPYPCSCSFCFSKNKNKKKKRERIPKVKNHRASPTLSFQNKETEIHRGRHFPKVSQTGRELKSQTLCLVFFHIYHSLISGRGVSTTTKY